MIDLENSMILEFSLDKQTLKRADDFHPVEKSEVYLQMHFTFDKDWDNTKRHVFFQYRNEKVYEQILTSDSCYVPIEVIKKYGFYVWLIGYDIATGEVKIPTNQLRVNVYEGSEEETGETTYVTDIVSDTITFEKSGNVYKAEIPNKYVTGIRYDEKTGIIEFLGRTENGIEKVISVIDLPIDKGTLGYDDTEIKKAIEKLQKEKANASEVLDENEIKSLIDENVPKKTSQLENDNQFINRVVDDLVNYYKKTETYTKTEINNLISAIPKFNILVVESLPTSDISLTTVYLLKENEDGGNLYTEYIYANGSWEILGSQKIDLTGYATEKWVEGKGYLTEHQDISGKAEKTVVEEIDKRLSTAEKELENKVEIVEGKELSSNDFTDQLLNKLDGIEAGANKYVLPTDVVKDSNYVHTDNNFTTLEKNKLSNLKNYDDTIVQERLDKAEEELEKKQTKLTAGENITILEDGTISANITAEDVSIQVDKTLDSKSENPIANKPVYEAINALNTNKADKNITINSKPLSENIDLSKSDIGLGNVVNTGDSATPVSGGTTKFTTGGAYTELAKKVDKVTGYGLSKNDLTDELLAKLNSLSNYDDTEVQNKIKEIETILTSDDTDLDTLQELVTALKNNTASINDIFTAIASKQDKINVDSNNDVLVFNEDELSTHYEVTSSSNVGGIKSGDNVSGTIKDVLDMLLGTPTAFAFNSIGGKNGGTYEKGFSITVSEAVATVTKGTAKTINSIVITSGGSTLGSTSSPQDGSNTIPLSTTSFSDSKTFNATLTYNNNKTISKSISFSYIYRFYYGTTTKALADLIASDITSMSSKLSSSFSGIAITMNQSCSVIAVPNTTNYTVYDENGYNVTDNFEKKTLTISNTYGISTTYTIWKLKTAVTGSKTYRLA